MSSSLNSQIIKKFDDIKASPEVADAIDELKAKKEILPGICPIWATSLMQMDIPAPSYMVESLVSDNGITILSSKPGTFKTWFAFDIAYCVSTGNPLFGVYATKQTKVLIIDQESGYGRVKRRLAALGADEADIAVISFANVMMTNKYAKAIVKYCKENGVGLVVFDSLTRFHTAKENTSDEMSVVLSHFQLLPQSGIAVIIIHHDPKSGYVNPDSSNTLRGSGDILAICDIHFVLQQDKYSKNKVIVKQLKNRDDELISDFELIANNNDDKTKFWFEYSGEAPKQKNKDEIAEEAVIEFLRQNGRTIQGKIITALKGIAGMKKVPEILNSLVARQLVELTIGERGGRYFELLAENNDE